MSHFYEVDLPGIGRKYEIQTQTEDKLVVIVHDDGDRELFHFHPDQPEQSMSMVTLDDVEARQIAGILGGLHYQPKELDTVEVVLERLHIEWYKLKSNSTYVNQTIGQSGIRQKTGVTILAAIEKGCQQIITPGSDYKLKANSLLVVAGESRNIKSFKKTLAGD